MSIEDSVVAIQGSMKLYEVKSVFIITDFKNTYCAIVLCTYDTFPTVDGVLWVLAIGSCKVLESSINCGVCSVVINVICVKGFDLFNIDAISKNPP